MPRGKTGKGRGGTDDDRRTEASAVPAQRLELGNWIRTASGESSQIAQATNST